MRGEIYYPGVTEEHGVELTRLSSDTVDGIPGLLRIQAGEAPVVRWREVFGAVSYEVQVVDLASGSASAATFAVAENHWEIPEALRAPALRVWVRAIRDEAGAQYLSRWSNQLDFTI
ncbi:MAG: hypothetical protein H7Z17_11190 [Fuerstia sp.]|nr:hypothetical protein [Fuerstiella sp.]